MAENEASTLAAPLPASPAAFPQAAPETYPASAPTAVQATYPAAGPAPVPPVYPPSGGSAPTATHWAMDVTQALPPDRPATAGTGPFPVAVAGVETGPQAVPAAAPAAQETLSGPRNDPPRNDFIGRLRTPAMAAAAGGVLVLAVGFGAGFVVGRDHAGTGSTTGVQPGAGGFPGGGTGFGGGGGQGQGRQGFGGPMGQQGTNGQSQPGTDGSTGADGSTGTTDTTGLDQFQ